MAQFSFVFTIHTLRYHNFLFNALIWLICLRHAINIIKCSKKVFDIWTHNKCRCEIIIFFLAIFFSTNWLGKQQTSLTSDLIHCFGTNLNLIYGHEKLKQINIYQFVRYIWPCNDMNRIFSTNIACLCKNLSASVRSWNRTVVANDEFLSYQTI